MGDTERALKELFTAAKGCGQAIIFFDEIDGLFVSRDSASHMGALVRN